MSFSPTQALLLLQLQEGNRTVRTGSDFILTNNSTLGRWLREEERDETQQLLPKTTYASFNSRKHTFRHTSYLQLFQQVKCHQDISDNGALLAKPQFLWVGPRGSFRGRSSLTSTPRTWVWCNCLALQTGLLLAQDLLPLDKTTSPLCKILLHTACSELTLMKLTLSSLAV